MSHDTVGSRRRRRILPLIGGIALLPLAVVIGVAGAVVGFVGTAAFTTHVSLLSAVGLAVCFASATALGWLAGRLVGWVDRRRIAIGIGCGTVVLVFVVSSLTVFRPLVPATEIIPLDVPPEVGFWELPTGSRIAHREVPATASVDETPVIYLHGGPGAGVVWVEELVDAFSFPARLGHDVYFYDQIGGGLSGRLSDVSQYGLERHIADLEAIRRRIDAATIILIGESWGAQLAAHYVAVHPGRVDKLVLVYPGALYDRDWGDREPCDLIGRAPAEIREQFVLLERPRLLAATLLLEVNPLAAHAFLADAEGDAFARRLFSSLLPGMVCDPATLPDGEDFGFGFWGNIMTDEDYEAEESRIYDSLAEIEIPVLIIRGACDYCVPEVAVQYDALLPSSTLVHVDGAGHLLWLERPDVLAAVVGPFLSGGPPPGGARSHVPDPARWD